MAYEHAQRHIRALQLAKSCVELGARLKTVAHLTGLSSSLLREYFFNGQPFVCGRWPDSQDWYHAATLVERAEASLLASIFTTLRSDYACPAQHAMVSAYKMYRERWTGRPSITFDRAFELISRLEGIWTHRAPQLEMHTCLLCQSRHVIALGDLSAAHAPCVFCRLVKRYATDSRIQARFTFKPGWDLPAARRQRLDYLLGAEQSLKATRH